MEFQDLERYDHRIVATESTDECACNAAHDEGDVLWGGRIDPRDHADIDAFETVEEFHDVAVEYESD